MIATSASQTCGLLLAAGAGTRFGFPKALAVDPDGAWLTRAVMALRLGGCDQVVAVVGAAAAAATELLDAQADIVVATQWADGLAASLLAGLRYCSQDSALQAAVVHLVDLPDVGAPVVRRFVDRASPSALARATYPSGPGHPVLIGRNHWAGVEESASGDRGAGRYLMAVEHEAVACGDLADGHDIDHAPPGVVRWTSPRRRDA